MYHRPTHSFALCSSLATLAALLVATPATAATPETTLGFALNSGAALHPFVPNYGQDPVDVLYAARSFGG